MQQREDPIIKPALVPPVDPGHSAAIIYIHGLGDEAEGVCNIADQFQSAKKLPHVKWIFPNALENRDAMQRAWYTPTPLTPFPPSRPELEEEEDEEGLRASIKYVESLVDGLTSKGIPPNRIVLAGFSQGCALSLLTALISQRYAGKFAGVAGMMGYLPLAEKLQRMRSEEGLPEYVGSVPILLARGERDMLVPKRYFRICRETLEKLGLHGEFLEIKEYEDLGHAVNGAVLKDFCAWLERVIPALE
ncbi:alpha/beta-hydrolase [Saccharata proteae CBS 121410]|uniref:Acyl-protein thioesterase 1 n=1 Tax=Saccharata proteae CBS 121410 TaxID=1314787 RepID=A0A9P4LXM5_9PEZI|nr:alpha/beta-hydrolase [Saccharata proteae CBS 121410]